MRFCQAMKVTLGSKLFEMEQVPIGLEWKPFLRCEPNNLARGPVELGETLEDSLCFRE
jgi:hypothetical protein